MNLKSISSLSLLANQQPSLHGIRVVAILLVIQFHVLGAVIPRAEHHKPFYQIGMSLWFGMDLFFILSGFLIGTLLLISIEKKGSVTMANFYARRSFRIIPLYVVVLTFYVLIATKLPADGKYLWAEYFYLTNYLKYQHMHFYWGWSLAVEEHFYIAVPFVMLLLMRVKSIPNQLLLLTLLWASCFFVRLYIWNSQDGNWPPAEWFAKIYMPTHTRYDTLLAGIWLAIFQSQYGDRVSVFIKNSTGIRVGLLTLTVVSFGFIVLTSGYWSTPTLYRSLSVGTVTTLGWVPLLIYLLNCPGFLSNFFGLHIFRQLATLGYGVYLVHLIVIQNIAGRIVEFLAEYGVGLYPACLVVFVLTVSLSFTIAYFLHIIIEKPALAMRDKLT